MNLTNVPRIGQLLVQRNVINDEQLDAALEEQRLSRGKLGEILVRKDLVSLADLNSALLDQYRMKLAAVLLAFGTSMLPATAPHGGESSQLLLIGRVAPTSSVSVMDNATRLDVPVTGGQDTGAVARITERSNNPHGYSVLLQASNFTEGGKPALTRDGNQSDRIPYRLTFDGHDVYFIEGSAVISDVPGGDGNQAPVTRELRISADQLGEPAPGAWSDTLTLVVVVK